MADIELKDLPYFPYPRDPIRQIGFLIGDTVAWTIILGIAFIALKATLHF